MPRPAANCAAMLERTTSTRLTLGRCSTGAFAARLSQLGVECERQAGNHPAAFATATFINPHRGSARSRGFVHGRFPYAGPHPDD